MKKKIIQFEGQSNVDFFYQALMQLSGELYRERCEDRYEGPDMNKFPIFVDLREPIPTIPVNEEERRPEKKEAINHPSYYGGDTVYEAIKVIEAWELDFHLGNTVKYIARKGKKDPSKELQDLKKARWYLDRKIQNMENEKANGRRNQDDDK